LASIEAIFVHFDSGSARDGNVIGESLVVVVDFEPFCTVRPYWLTVADI
jgi:hypothetical protein